MSKLRMKQMISNQVPTTVQPFNFCKEQKKVASPTEILSSEDPCSATKHKSIKKSKTMREEILKKTSKIGSPDVESYTSHKPLLKLRLSPDNLNRNKLKTSLKDWKSISPKCYLTKEFPHNLSIHDLVHNHKSISNPVLQKNHQVLYKTKSGLLEKLRISKV